MNRKLNITLRIVAGLFSLGGLVLLGISMAKGRDRDLLGWALILVNTANLGNILLNRQERKDEKQKPVDRVLTVCAIVLAVALVVMVIALLI